MKKMYLFFLVFVFNVSSLFPQSYLDNYEGIPIITFGWVTSFTWLDAYNFNKVKEMGTDIFIPTDVIASKFDKYRLANLKLIPYQQFTREGRVNYIAKYTEAAYSLWEAEGNDDAQGQIKMIPDYDHVDIDSGFAIKTKNNTSGYLLNGPHYLQPVKYTIFSSEVPADIESEVLNFTVRFKLKVESVGGNFVSLTNNSDNICRIEVFTGDTLLAIDTIQAQQFSYYNEWKTFDLIYSNKINASTNTTHPVQPRTIYLGSETVERTAFADVKFRVYFYGTSTNYLSLSVDNILAFDDRGNYLMNNPDEQRKIIRQAKDSANVNLFTTNATEFDTTVVGWYAVDEPGFIDNWACVKKVKELIEENVPNKKLVTTIAGCWNGGIYRGNPDYDYSAFRIDELKKRTGLDEVIMNNFIYDYPYNEGEK